jgi:predicted patatin/cPLA2 family phospholipase
MVPMTKETNARRARVPIVIPGAEFMTKEELKKAKHNEAMRRLMARRRGGEPTEVKNTKQEIRKLDTQGMIDMATDTRNLAIQALNNKLVEVNMDPELMAKTTLKELATVFGILIDKSRLMEGLSTSNVSIQAKIDVNMTSDKAIEELNRMREGYQKDNG